MAVKRSLLDPYTWDDLFDTDQALQEGKIYDVKVGMENWQNDKNVFGVKVGTDRGSMPVFGHKDTFAKKSGFENNILAMRDLKKTQKQTAKAGFGVTQSILGGSVV